MLANYHTHTPRCKHASGTEREYIEAAIKAGFKVLGFSDHVPQPYPEGYNSPIRMNMSELADYTSVLSELREEYKDKINILIGYEVEYSRKYFKPMLKELIKYPIDYMILGQHYVPDEIEGYYTGCQSYSEEDLKAYVEFVTEGMNTGLFTYLAHPDLFNFAGSEKIYKKHMKKIIEASLELDIPLEINLYGLIDGRHYPSEKFFKMASEMGAKFVLGCDAHIPRLIMDASRRSDMARFLKNCNIRIGDNLMRISDNLSSRISAYLKKK